MLRRIPTVLSRGGSLDCRTTTQQDTLKAVSPCTAGQMNSPGLSMEAAAVSSAHGVRDRVSKLDPGSSRRALIAPFRNTYQQQILTGKRSLHWGQASTTLNQAIPRAHWKRSRYPQAFAGSSSVGDDESGCKPGAEPVILVDRAFRANSTPPLHRGAPGSVLDLAARPHQAGAPPTSTAGLPHRGDFAPPPPIPQAQGIPTGSEPAGKSCRPDHSVPAMPGEAGTPGTTQDRPSACWSSSPKPPKCDRSGSPVVRE